MRLLALLLCTTALFAKSKYASEYDAVYGQIRDIFHPTYQDFLLVEKYLKEGDRPYLKWLDEFYDHNDGLRNDLKMRNFKLVEDRSRATFDLKREFLNRNPNYRDWCVVSYASLNHNYEYPKKIGNMARQFFDHGFKGHFLYRIGGWPDLEGGSLSLAHVPYAFKVCMMKEAKSLGYKKVLWLDTSMKPLRNFDEIFRILERDGYFILSHYALRAGGSEMSRLALGLSEDEYRTVKQVVGGIVGVNFDHPQGLAFFEALYKAARDLEPFLAPRSDMVAMGSIAYKLGLTFTGTLDDVCAIYNDNIHPNHYFYIGY